MGVDKAGRYYVNGEGERAAPATAAIAPDTQRLRCGLARRPKSSGPPDCNASRQPADRAAATASRQANERGKDGRRWTFHPSPRRHTRRHTAGAGRSDPPAEGGTTSGGAGREGGRKPDALPSKGMQQGATGTGAIERAPSAPVSQGRCARRGRGGDASHGGRVAQAWHGCSRQGRRGATAGAREGGQRGRRRVGEGWAGFTLGPLRRSGWQAPAAATTGHTGCAGGMGMAPSHLPYGATQKVGPLLPCLRLSCGQPGYPDGPWPGKSGFKTCGKPSAAQASRVDRRLS